jgi:hypothetical protein
MQRVMLLSLTFLLTFGFCHSQQDTTTKTIPGNLISRVEMHLTAFGVESDSFPSIEALLDFMNDSSLCKKSYYNPAIKPSTYRLSDVELKHVLQLLQTADLDKLKTDYKVSKTDQPTSVITIYRGKQKYVVKDCGLEGDYPLQDVYKIVYRY